MNRDVERLEDRLISLTSKIPMNGCLDLSRSIEGAAFFMSTVEKRLEYRLRRQLEIDFISQQLMSQESIYDLQFPLEFFVDAIEATDKNWLEKERLKRHLAAGGTFRLPVFISDYQEPPGHSKVSDGSGDPIEVMNRFETAELWSTIAIGDVMGVAEEMLRAAVRCDFDDEGKRAVVDLAVLLKEDTTVLAVGSVLGAMAWMNAKPTGKRADRYRGPSCTVLITGQDPWTNDGLFFEGLPAPPCFIETLAMKTFGWACEEASYITRSAEGEARSLYDRNLILVSKARDIQRITAESRKELRDADMDCMYDVIVSETCPIVSPLYFVRGHCKLEQTEDMAPPLERISEYMNYCETYLDLVYNLVLVMVGFAKAGKVAPEEQKEHYRRRTRRLLHTFANIRDMALARRTIAVMEVKPNHGYTVREELLLKTLPISPRSQRKATLKRVIQWQILCGRESIELLTGQDLWNQTVNKTWLYILLRTISLWFSRGLWQQAIKFNIQNFRYAERRRQGFLTAKVHGRKERTRVYRAIPLATHSIPKFFCGDSKTQHIVVNLEGTELEIRPETTFIKTPQAVIDKRGLKAIERQSQADEEIAGMRREIEELKKSGLEVPPELIQAVGDAEFRIREDKSHSRERRKSCRCTLEAIFGNVYLSDDFQWLRLYTTKTEDEMAKACLGIPTDTLKGTDLAKTGREAPYNARRVSRIGRDPVVAIPEWYLDPHLIIGVRLRKELRTALWLIIGLFLGMTVAVGFAFSNPDVSRTMILVGLAAVQLAVLTFLLGTEYSHVFANHAARWHRGCIYMLMGLQWVIALFKLATVHKP